MQKQQIQRLQQMLCELMEIDDPIDAYENAVRIGAVIDDDRSYQIKLIEAVYTMRDIPKNRQKERRRI